ncbi:serine-protein kinase ATM-like [Ptychodera flava]|uniref:serine-protein kinase ATM-like n=1 Tax=Ptychodera flava TaxID=63121 RepID=UPI00396A65FA
MGLCFKCIRKYICKEIEVIRKAKTGSVTTINRRKQEISTLFKWTIRVANKRGERLKCGEIVQHVTEIMDDDFTLEAFGVDYSNVLLKDILKVRKYWCELSAKTWHSLLTIYCGTMLEPPPRFNRDVLAQLIYVLVSGATTQCGLQGRRFFSFFEKVLKQLRTEKSGLVLWNIIAAMNIFCRSVAVNARRQLCKLGEDILSTLLALWSSRPSVPLKDEIAEFLRLQMSVHHPNGVIDESHGAYANDFDVWKSHLRKLYEAIYTDLQQRGGRSKFSSSARETEMKASYVDLAADVFHQILAEKTIEIEVTQAVFTISTQAMQGSRAKKRRIESGWEMIRDAVTQLGQTRECIPWLQLSSALLRKHPRGIPSEEIQPFLSVLHQMLTETKRTDVTRWLLKCLQSLAVCQSCQPDSQQTSEVSSALWNKVWTATLRTISLHHAEASGFDLIRILKEKNLVTGDKEIWRLLLQGKCQLNQSAVCCLATLLKHCPLPENLQASTAVGIATETNERYPLRRNLLKWLLSMEDDTEVAERTVKVVDRPDLDLLAQVVVTLTQRHTSTIAWNVHPQLEDSEYREIETIYLKSTFDFNAASSRRERTSEPVTPSTSVQTVLKFLIKSLEKLGKDLTENTSTEVSHLQNVIHHCALVSKVMALLLGYKAVTKDEVMGSKLFEQLRVLFKRISDGVRDIRGRRETELANKSQNLSIITKALMELYSWNRGQSVPLPMTDAVNWMASNCRRFTQPDLIDGLLETANTKNVGRSSLSTTAFGDIDDDFMDVDLQESRAEDDFDFDVPEDATESPDTSETTQNTACVSLLDIELTEQQSLSLDSLRLLCAWCTGSSNDRQSSGQVSPSVVKKSVLKLLEEEVFDVYKPVDVQMFLVISTGLLIGDSNDPELHTQTEAILHTLKDIVSAHRKDQEICSAALKLLSDIIPSLGSTQREISDELESARSFALRLVSGFWKLQREGQYASPVRLSLAKCMEEFIKLDLDGKWAFITQATKQRGDGDNASDIALTELFPDLLMDKNHGIRMHMAEAIPCLFVKQSDSGPIPVSTDLQDRAFTQVVQRIQEAATVPDRLQSEEHADEWNNRAASLLKTLSSIICVSPVCQKRCVFALIQCIKENNIDITVMNKVLQEISSHLKYPTIQSFLECHLGYIISCWLEVGYSLEEIPYKIFGCENRVAFFRYRKVDHSGITVSGSVPQITGFDCSLYCIF